jgi:hypothetical protein
MPTGEQLEARPLNPAVAGPILAVIEARNAEAERRRNDPEFDAECKRRDAAERERIRREVRRAMPPHLEQAMQRAAQFQRLAKPFHAAIQFQRAMQHTHRIRTTHAAPRRPVCEGRSRGGSRCGGRPAARAARRGDSGDSPGSSGDSDGSDEPGEGRAFRRARAPPPLDVANAKAPARLGLAGRRTYCERRPDHD